jgi:hypothetical protein
MAPLSLGAGFELALFTAGAVVRPFGADFGGGGAEGEFAPIVGWFFPLAAFSVPRQSGQGDVFSAEVDGFFWAKAGVVEDGEEGGQPRAAGLLRAYSVEEASCLGVVDDGAPVDLG